MNTTLEIRAFGSPTVRIDGADPPVELLWRKHLGLLLYLARSPGGIRRRDHLVGLLWPDKADARARHSLNEACRAIRKGLGDEALVTRGEEIVLQPGATVADWDAADRAMASDDADALLLLWRGDFLEGFGIPDAGPFEDWLAAERTEWRRRFRDAVTAAARRASAAGRHAEAIALAERVLRADPLAEGALRVAMTADALSGAAPAALARHAVYMKRLREEAGAAPAADLSELADRIRAGQRHTELATPAEPLPPLVGRAAALAALEPWLPARAGRAAVILATGAAGSGRTRLVREAAERARLDGARVMRVTCVRADSEAPGAILSLLLRRGLSAVSGLGATPPEALAILAGLSPEIAQRYPGVAPQASDAVTDLGRAFGEALAAIAGDGPVAVVLDDVHLADARSLEALPALLRAADVAGVTLMLTVRTDAPIPAAVNALRARIGRDIPGIEVAVPPLEDAAIATLIARMLPAWSPDEQDRLRRRLVAETGGLPLFLVEILHALATHGGPTPFAWPAPGATTAQPLPFPIPGAVVAALTLRAAALDAFAGAALRAAAVAGPRPHLPLVAALLGVSVDDAERSFDTLVRTGFLRDEDGIHVFAAEMIRVFIEQELLAGSERRRLQREAAALRAAGTP